MAQTKTIKINVDTKSATAGVDNLNNSIKQTGNETKNVSTNASNMGGNLNAISGGAVGKFTALKTTVLGVATSFKSLGFAIAATGIGALIIAILAVKQAFTASEEGQNKWTRITEKLGIIVGKVTDAIADFGDLVITVVGKIGSGLAKGATYVTKFFDTITFGAFGAEKALNKLSDANDKISKRANERAGQIAKADVIERNLVTERAKADRKIAEFRDKAAQKDLFSLAERQKALKDAVAIEEKITKKEIEAAKIRAAVKTSQNADAKSTKEDKLEEANLIAKVTELETASIRTKKRLNTELVSTRNEARAEEKAAAAESKSRRDAEAKQIEENNKKEAEGKKNALEAIQKLEQSYSDSKLSAQDLEILNVDRKYQKEIELAIKYKQDTTSLLEAQEYEKNQIKQKYLDKELADLIAKEDAQFKLSQELNYNKQEQEIANLVESYEAKFAIAGENDELEKLLIEQQKEEIAAINQKYADKEIADNEAQAKRLKDIEQKKKDDKIQGVKDGLSVIANLAELFAGKSRKQQKKAFDIQKAVNIAGATIDTYKAATAAYASMIASTGPAGPILAPLAAAAAITAGLLNVKKIASQKFDGGGSPSGGGGGGGGGASLPDVQQQAPSFNIVGNSNVNQLSQLQNQPMKAYVVSGDVSSAQSLDRNRIENATL